MRRPLPLVLLVVVLLLAGGQVVVDTRGRDEARLAPGGRAATTAGRVVTVTDGDTLRVDVGRGGDERVRLIGIDTPELHRPETPVECGARAAAAAMARRAASRRVRLVGDPTQDARDRYGRRLAYVELADGEDLGEAMVRDGWAEPYVYDRTPFARVGRYRRAARAAARAGRGVHGACGGTFHSAG